MDRRYSAVVFVGPTVPLDEARAALDALYLPPAAQGAIVRCVLEHEPAAILLIDGVFQGEPTVRHKEILWALSHGVAVYGAASMGALRAAELHPAGMTGVGLIYRWYRRFPLAADDAVAVLHGPAEIGAPALTVSLIDLRFTLRAAERAGLLAPALRQRLERAAIGLNFRDRTFEHVVEAALVGTGAGEAAALRRAAPHLPQLMRSQKRHDARAALARLSRDLGTPAANRNIGKHFVMTSAFLKDLRDSGIVFD